MARFQQPLRVINRKHKRRRASSLSAEDGIKQGITWLVSGSVRGPLEREITRWVSVEKTGAIVVDRDCVIAWNVFWR